MSKSHDLPLIFWVSYCCEVLFELRFCISLENFSSCKKLESSIISKLKKNVQFELLIMILMFVILRYLENVSMDWRTGLVWDAPETRYGFLEIYRVFTTILKNSRKISGTFFSFEMVFSFLISVIVSLVFILRKGAQSFSNFLLSFTCFRLRFSQ